MQRLLSPIEIPLVVDIISPFLDSLDVARCCLVSRTWNDAFTPSLWQSVVVRRKYVLRRWWLPWMVPGHRRNRSSPSTPIHTPTLLSRLQENTNACRVRSLTVYYASMMAELEEQLYSLSLQEHGQKPHLRLDPFPNLTVLRCLNLPRKPLSMRLNSPLTASIALFLERWGRHLTVLEIEFFDLNDNQGYQGLLAFLQGHRQLKELTLMAPSQTTCNRFRGLLMSLSCSTMAPLEKVKLAISVSFEILEPWHIELFPDTPWFDFSRKCSAAPMKRASGLITDLDISGIDGKDIQVSILSQFLKTFCPKLKRLVPPMLYVDCIPTLCDAIETGLPNLRHLDLSGAMTTDLETTDILEACGKTFNFTQDRESLAPHSETQGLKSFRGPTSSSDIGSNSIEALVSLHSRTLQEIDLSQCFAVSGSMIKTILRTCPRLVRFKTLKERLKEPDPSERYLMTSSKSATRDPFVHFREQERDQELSEQTGYDMSPTWASVLMTLPTLMEGGRWWACAQTLRVLSLQYLETSSEVFPWIFSEQLSKLVHLEELRLRRRSLLASSRPLRSPGASPFSHQTTTTTEAAVITADPVDSKDKPTLLELAEEMAAIRTASALAAAALTAAVATPTAARTMDPLDPNRKMTMLELFSKPKTKSYRCLQNERRVLTQKRLQVERRNKFKAMDMDTDPIVMAKRLNMTQGWDPLLESLKKLRVLELTNMRLYIDKSLHLRLKESFPLLQKLAYLE